MGFLPRKDAELLAWSSNFTGLINATPATYGLTAAQAAAYQALHDTYAAAYAVVTEPSTKTKVTVADKNDARYFLRQEAGRLSMVIQGQANVTDGQKLALGLTVYDREPTPIPAPAMAPAILVLSTVGRTVNIRILDSSDPVRRARPEGVSGITILSHIGNEPPVELSEWVFQGNTSRTEGTVQFPSSVGDGGKVWITAFYFNPRKQSGPAATPVSANLPGGNVQTMAA